MFQLSSYLLLFQLSDTLSRYTLSEISILSAVFANFEGAECGYEGDFEYRACILLPMLTHQVNS